MSGYEVTHSSEAATAADAARVARARVAKPNGWWGMAILVASEATLFGVFLGTYYYLRVHALHWPPPGTPRPDPVVPFVLAGVLATTSLPMVLALRAARAGRRVTAWWLVLWAFLVQCGYLAYELNDLQDQLARSRPQDNAYASIYYLTLGADHAHVFLGILLSLWLLARLATGLTNYRLTALRATTFYWHFVNVLTLLVVAVLVSPGLS